MGLKLQMSERCMTEVLRNVVSFTSMIDCHSRQARAFWGNQKGVCALLPPCKGWSVFTTVFSQNQLTWFRPNPPDATWGYSLSLFEVIEDDQTLPAVKRKGCFWWLLLPPLVGMQADPQAAEVWLKRMGLMLRPTAVTFTALLKGARTEGWMWMDVELQAKCNWTWDLGRCCSW